MRTVHKHDLARQVAARVGEPIAAVEAVVDALLDQIVKELASGRKVTLSGFLTLTTAVRKPRRVRRPGSTETIEIPARTKVVVRAGAELKRWVEARMPEGLPSGAPAGGADDAGELHVDADAIRDALGRLGKDADGPG